MTKRYKNFTEYLDKANVISAGVGFATGLAVNKFFTVFIDAFIINAIKQTGGRMDDLNFRVGNIVFPYGPTLVSLINLAAVLAVSYGIIKASNRFLGWS